jgi:hypothetical protein
VLSIGAGWGLFKGGVVYLILKAVKRPCRKFFISELYSLSPDFDDAFSRHCGWAGLRKGHIWLASHLGVVAFTDLFVVGNVPSSCIFL